MMKTYYKIFTVFALASLMFTACDDGDAVVDTVTAETERGAILRTVNLISNELPIGKDDANFSVEVEVQDVESGDLVNSVEVYLGFRDNTVEDGGTDLDKDEILITTLDVASFSVGEFGFPRTTYTITLPEMLSALSLDGGDLDGGDQFSIRFELVLDDGRRFSFANNSGTLTGSFFSSPFLYTPTVICEVPADKFVGTYLLTTDASTPSPAGGGATWTDGGVEVELTVGETSSQRIFEAVYLADLGIGNGPRPFTMDLVCGEVIIPAGQASGLQCSAGITFGPPSDDQENGTYDISAQDDSVITFWFTEDEAADCGTAANVLGRLVKQ
ncbi:hypothetical protein FK220_002750 [Flavobacteriaceae bacterium TP-CH-4]|uniref:DUF4382 domain-containing protein n=1 Tax=Pelagihabitans pacificus TaxID=2696054 RepID=A0A967E567_9FLAO|nr:hypothetical protein [Pelagihabitans pacificus]NHF58245.1 hypothetical protein [Pelagihabitans pacificus]